MREQKNIMEGMQTEKQELEREGNRSVVSCRRDLILRFARKLYKPPSESPIFHFPIENSFSGHKLLSSQINLHDKHVV